MIWYVVGIGGELLIGVGAAALGWWIGGEFLAGRWRA